MRNSENTPSPRFTCNLGVKGYSACRVDLLFGYVDLHRRPQLPYLRKRACGVVRAQRSIAPELCKLPYDFGKKTGGGNMGGVGSGNWYRFDKKATTGECHSLDVRYLHRNGLLKAGGWFSLRWSRGEHETGSIGGSVEGGHLRSRPERVILRYRCRSGPSKRFPFQQVRCGDLGEHRDGFPQRDGEELPVVPCAGIDEPPVDEPFHVVTVTNVLVLGVGVGRRYAGGRRKFFGPDCGVFGRLADLRVPGEGGVHQYVDITFVAGARCPFPHILSSGP